MQKSRFGEPDVDERRLHAGQNANDLAFVDVPHDPAIPRALEVDLGERLILDQRDARLLGRGS